jgi:MOSC domain-containing protein YiiM
MDPSGTLEAIYIRPAARLDVRCVESATAVAGKGLQGDHAGGGKRQVTLLDAARWREVCAEFGRAVDPAVRRANLLIEGLDLGSCIGRELAIGDVRIEVLGETRPCELMDDDGRVGLAAAMRPRQRGGVFGRLRRGGELRCGQPVSVIEAPDRGRAGPGNRSG